MTCEISSIQDPSGRSRGTPRRLLLWALALALGLTALSACYRDSESRLVEIRALQDGGDFEASIEPIRVLLHTDPTQAEANFRLGIALVQTGRTGLAIWPLQKASQTQKYGIQAGLILARLLYNAKDYEEAIRTTDQVLVIDPERAAALDIRAKANIGAGDPEAALDDAQRLLDLETTNYEAYLIRAAALIDLDRVEEAEQAHREMLATSLELANPEVATRACALLAAHMAANAKLGEAEAQYIACLTDYPANPMVMQYATTFYLDLDRPDDAIAIWRKAADDIPEDFALRSSLADLLANQDRLDQAEQVLMEAVEIFDTAVAWQTLSAFYKKQGDPTQAREALENAIDRAPGQSDSLQFALADLLLTEGDLERAASVAEEIREPAYQSLVRGGIRLQEGDPKGALEIFESGLRLWPNNPGARYLAGSAAERLGDIDRATAEYREAVRVDPGATDAALQLAKIHFALGEFRTAKAFATQQIRERPLSGSDAYVLAVRAASAMGNHEEARSLLEDLQRTDADAGEILVERAAVARQAQGPGAAVALILESRLDTANPDSFPVLMALAENLTAHGQSDKALTYVGQALASEPDNPDLFDLQGRIQLRSGKTQAAGESLARALALDPEHARALHAQASLAASQGDLDSALELARRAAESTEVVNEKAVPLYTAAQLSLLLGRQTEAITLLEETLRFQPGHVQASNDLAWQLAEIDGDLNRALELAERAAAREPTGTTLDTLGWVQLKRGNVNGASRSFENALDRTPDNPTIRYHWALALAKQNENERAVELLKQALEGADFAEREQAQQTLSRLELQ